MAFQVTGLIPLTDHQAFAAYRRQVGATLHPHGGRAVARGRATVPTAFGVYADPAPASPSPAEAS